MILDASWTHAEHRHAAERLAVAHCADLVALQCRARPEIATRIATRHRTPSDATPAIAAAMAAAADPWPRALPVDTEGPTEQSIDRAASAWHGATHRAAESIRG